MNVFKGSVRETWSKISSDQKRLLFAVSLTPFHFSRTLPLRNIKRLRNLKTAVFAELALITYLNTSFQKFPLWIKRISAMRSKSSDVRKNLYLNFDLLLLKEGSSECGRSETWSYVENVGTGWWRTNFKAFFISNSLFQCHLSYFV